jgi:hypothetical protein
MFQIDVRAKGHSVGLRKPVGAGFGVPGAAREGGDAGGLVALDGEGVALLAVGVAVAGGADEVLPREVSTALAPDRDGG